MRFLNKFGKECFNAIALQHFACVAAEHLIGEKTEYCAAGAGHRRACGAVFNKRALDLLDALSLRVRKRLLKDVAHVRTERVRVAALDGGEHRVRIRTVGDRYTVYAREERGRGDREVRLADGDKALRRGIQNGQLFTAALGELCAAADAEGNVAADTRTDLLEPLVRERGGDKIAQCAQHRRCVRAAAGHTGCST